MKTLIVFVLLALGLVFYGAYTADALMALLGALVAIVGVLWSAYRLLASLLGRWSPQRDRDRITDHPGWPWL